MAVEVVTPPAEEPVSLQEAKEHLRVEVSAEDALITRLISDAREWAERYTRRAFVVQTWRLWARQFPDGWLDQEGIPARRQSGTPGCDLAIYLPGGLVKTIEKVSYTDPNGAVQTLADTAYKLDSKSPQRIARLVPAWGTTWPATRDEPNAVLVEYTTGYGAASQVPAIIKQAILLHVGWNYETREAGDRDKFLQSLEMKLADVRLFTFA